NNFLDDLFNSENGLKLDFIFGTREYREVANKKEYCFIPLDGQQRLTTLFLLHLYGWKTGVYNCGGGDLLQKFSYDTRRAAKDFCASILEHWVIVDNANNNKIENDVLSKRIVNSTWFMDYWQYDPTVSSMLTMLDAIHEKTQKKGKEHYPKLDEINFYFFDMEEHNLSESLYLKMNARGKPLTAFENFKSAIEAILPKDVDCSMFEMLKDTNLSDDANHLDDFSSKWKYCIDRQWTDFFWQYKEDYLIDGPFMRFLCNSMSAYWVAKVKEKKDDAGNTILGNEGLPITEKQLTEDNTLKVLTSITGNENFIPFDLFKKIFQLDGAFQYFAKLLCNLVAYKDLIITNSKPGWKEEYDIIEKILNNPTYRDRVILYAISVFSDFGSEAEKMKKFKRWMRVVWNIVENSTIDSPGTFLSAIRLISTLAEDADDIYAGLKFKSKKRLESLGSRYHAQEQVEEEIAKAIKIVDDQREDWEKKIIEAENYAFFNGAIRFLFTDEDGSYNWDGFEAKFKKAQEYFDNDGVKEDYKKDAILLRSLIYHFTNWDQFWGITYDHKASSWKNILTKKEIIYPINKILTEDLDLNKLKNESQLTNLEANWEERQKYVHKDLYQTNLLSEITEGCSLKWRNSQYAIYPDYKRIPIVIGNKRNKMLSHFLEKGSISCDKKVKDDCNFFWGWDIDFEYNGQKFLWNTDENIYLINEEGKRMQDKFDKDICISTKGVDENNFLEKLDELPKSVTP
ncbi:MAG: DUF262 domain-containing protein, partial [Mobilitalea sp.]